MNILSVLAWLKPVTTVAALIPFLIAVMMWLLFYIRYDILRLKKIRSTFTLLSDAGKKLDDCSRENISFLDELTDSMAPPHFLEARRKMQMQLKNNFMGAFIPEGQSFYDFDDMITVPGCRSRLDILWRSFWVLSILTIALPAGTVFFLDRDLFAHALAFGGILFTLLCFGNLIFTLVDQKIYFSTTKEYHRFISTFNRVLPVAKAEVALLLEANQRNREVYKDAADRITGKVDSIVEDALLPALKDSIKAIMRNNIAPALQKIDESLDTNLNKTLELQDKGMERMTAAFADRLGNTVAAKMDGLSDMVGNLTGSIGNVNTRLEELNADLGQHVNELQEAMSRNVAMQEEKAAKLMQLQDERMTQALEHQEEAMQRISFAFSDSLNRTLDDQISSLAMASREVRGQMVEFNFSLGNHLAELMNTTEKSIELQKQQVAAFADDLHKLMSSLNTKISDNLDTISGMFMEQRQLMEESARILIDTGEAQERTISENKEILQKAVENSEFLNQQIQSMAATVDKLTEQTTAFSREAFTFTRETNEAQIRMSEDVKISQGKLEAAVNETMSQYSKMNSMISDMMDNITERMNEAMTNAGREIALGIKEVTADNAEAIGNLTEQAQNLRSDYDNYFTRLESSTSQILENMDYQIKDLIIRITEDIGAMMKENISANAEILNQYKDNTSELLQSFDEQARSIGLYAHEINMDITDLSNNLQASAAEFGKSIQEGVRLTLGEFDSGLSELSARIANTVESISDAVEALPEALGRR